MFGRDEKGREGRRWRDFRMEIQKHGIYKSDFWMERKIEGLKSMRVPHFFLFSSELKGKLEGKLC